MRAAADHLLDLGHRRVGLVLGPPIRTTRERRLGLEEAYVERGLERTYTVLEGHFTAEHGERATAILLSAPVLPTAIVAGSNQLFIGVMRELRRRALRIGLDVSLISCDEIPVTELLDPPIAVVRRDTREIGRRAAELLVTRIRDGGPPETAVLATTFIPRPSCIALSGERATFARD
jgi:LacI family transcriptional regulator